MLLSWETVNTILLVDEAERRCPSSLEQATHKDDPGQPARTSGAHRGAEINIGSTTQVFSSSCSFQPSSSPQITDSQGGLPETTNMRPAHTMSEEMTIQQIVEKPSNQ